MSAYDIALDLYRERSHRTDANPYSLSPRQIQVARCLAKGMNCGEIARQLSIGEGTVQTHKGRLAVKLSARNANHLLHLIDTLPGMPNEPTTVVNIDDFRDAYGMGWSSQASDQDVAFD